MTLAAIATPKTVLDAILDFLVPLILPSVRDRDAAGQAAMDLLSDHHPATREELRLAAEVVGFSLQALAALRDAAQPGIPISRAMRLRASACTLRRAEQAAQRKLDALQRMLLPAEPIQERAIAIAMKNAEPYFAGAYDKAREMGDALIAAEAAARSSTASGVTPAATQAHGQAPAGTAPTTGDSAAHAPAIHKPPAAQSATATQLTDPAGQRGDSAGTVAPAAHGSPVPGAGVTQTPLASAATGLAHTAPSASAKTAAAPPPRAPAQAAPATTVLAPSAPGQTVSLPASGAPTQAASAPVAPTQTAAGVTNHRPTAQAAPSPAALTAGPPPRQPSPHRPAPTYPPPTPQGATGAMTFPPGKIGATLRYMSETLARMDPNTSETGDFATDFLLAIERGLPTRNAQGPAAPAA